MNQKKSDEIFQYLEERKVQLYVMPNTDDHLSEYPSESFRHIKYITGFTGSNATLLWDVPRRKITLYTDSRYTLQAKRQLERTDVEILVDVDIKADIQERVGKYHYGRIAIDEALFSCREARELYSLVLYGQNLSIRREDLFPEIPPMRFSPIWRLEKTYSGESTEHKISMIRENTDATHLILTSLEEIAWLFNIRANDMQNTPVAQAFALVDLKNGNSFLLTGREEEDTVSNVNEELRRELKKEKIEVLPYDYFYKKGISQFLTKESVISWDDDYIPCVFSGMVSGYEKKKEGAIVTRIKSQKNEVELENLDKAQKYDSVAMANAYSEIADRIERNIETTEIDVAEILLRERRKQPTFVCESFPTIAGYASNGAVVHYTATPETSRKIDRTSLLLVDSGATYLYGTTDITRVFCYGEPTERQKHDYTLVLKGHISMTNQNFPENTAGIQLDAFARQFLWNECLDYGHGTGHGIGHVLCVHEGPQRISHLPKSLECQTPLLPRMILSDEPGLYREGEYGIRIENMVKVESLGRGYCQLEPVTFFPYERKLIQKEMLTTYEITWINEYHSKVYSRTFPMLSDERAKEWLRRATDRI